MSEDDTEFRDLISQTLESNGILGKIKAQLRASIFLALEDQDKFMSHRSAKHQELRDFLQTPEGRLALALVRDLLEYFELDHSLAVLRPETGLDEAAWRDLQQATAGLLRGGKSRPLLRDLAAGTSGEGHHTQHQQLQQHQDAGGASVVDSKSAGYVQQQQHKGGISSPERQPVQSSTGSSKFNMGGSGGGKQGGGASSGGASKPGSLGDDADNWLMDDDLLPVSGGVARSSGHYAVANSNNNNSSSLRGNAASASKRSVDANRPTAPSASAAAPALSNSGGGGFGTSARGGLDPLSSPQHSLSDDSSISGATAGRRSRLGGSGNNFDDLPPLPGVTGSGGSGGGGGGLGSAGAPERSRQAGESSMLSDQLHQAGDLVSDYMDDFEDSVGGGGGRDGGASASGALPSARSLKSQASDAGIEEVIEAEELTSAADDDPTDMTVDSEMSLAADYVEEAQRIGRSQL